MYIHECDEKESLGLWFFLFLIMCMEMNKQSLE